MARDAGFDAVEVLFPYDDPVGEVAVRLRDNDLTLALINSPPPNWAGGDRGVATVPGLVARDTFVQDLCWAAALVPDQSLTIEPINSVDMPGYF